MLRRAMNRTHSLSGVDCPPLRVNAQLVREAQSLTTAPNAKMIATV
jgi:hypothetical protein